MVKGLASMSTENEAFGKTFERMDIHRREFEEKIGKLESKLDGKFNALDKKIGECIKAEDVKHYYSTKFLSGGIAIGALIALCGAYIFVTPLLIDSKNSKLNEMLDNILKAVQTSAEKKTH